MSLFAPQVDGRGMIRQGFTRSNSILLAVLTLSFIVGETAHFLFGTISREMAQDIHFGTLKCYELEDYASTPYSDANECADLESESACLAAADEDANGTAYCEWDYSGQGIEYQVLAGPIFVVVFTISGIVMGFLGDKVSR